MARILETLSKLSAIITTMYERTGILCVHQVNRDRVQLYTHENDTLIFTWTPEGLVIEDADLYQHIAQEVLEFSVGLLDES